MHLYFISLSLQRNKLWLLNMVPTLLLVNESTPTLVSSLEPVEFNYQFKLKLNPLHTQDLVRKVARLGALLEGAKRVVFFTGAGVSVEAGIPGDSIYFCF